MRIVSKCVINMHKKGRVILKYEAFRILYGLFDIGFFIYSPNILWIFSSGINFF